MAEEATNTHSIELAWMTSDSSASDPRRGRPFLSTDDDPVGTMPTGWNPSTLGRSVWAMRMASSFEPTMSVRYERSPRARSLPMRLCHTCRPNNTRTSAIAHVTASHPPASESRTRPPRISVIKSLKATATPEASNRRRNSSAGERRESA